MERLQRCATRPLKSLIYHLMALTLHIRNTLDHSGPADEEMCAGCGAVTSAPSWSTDTSQPSLLERGAQNARLFCWNALACCTRYSPLHVSAPSVDSGCRVVLAPAPPCVSQQVSKWSRTAWVLQPPLQNCLRFLWSTEICCDIHLQLIYCKSVGSIFQFCHSTWFLLMPRNKVPLLMTFWLSQCKFQALIVP